MRIRYSNQTMKKLFSLSGNRCAFPGCDQRITNENKDLIGEICHIESANPGGERFNHAQTDKERADFDNLILLCSNHHKETNNVSIYTVDTLKAMKKNHEEHHSNNHYQISQSEIKDILFSINQNLIELTKTTDSGKKGLSDENPYKMKLAFSTLIPGYAIPGEMGLRPGSPCLGLKGMNTSERIISISSWGFELPNKSYLTKNPSCFHIKFPYEVKPGKSVQVWMEYSEIARYAKNSGYSGVINLKGFFKDEIDNKWEKEFDELFDIEKDYK